MNSTGHKQGTIWTSDALYRSSTRYHMDVRWTQQVTNKIPYGRQMTLTIHKQDTIWASDKLNRSQIRYHMDVRWTHLPLIVFITRRTQFLCAPRQNLLFRHSDKFKQFLLISIQNRRICQCFFDIYYFLPYTN